MLPAVRHVLLSDGGTPRQRLTRLLSKGNTVANYQPGIGVTGTLNASAWANQMGIAGSLAQATGANQPINLPFTGSKYWWLPGTNNNYLSTPNAAANQILGDIAIAVRVALDDWTPAVQANHLVSKWGGVGASAFQFRVASTTGLLTVLTSSDGTNIAFTSVSTAAPTIADASALWVLFTLDVDDGGGNNVVKFYTAADQASIPISWTQLGTTVTNVGTTSLFNANTAVTFGSVGTTGTLPGKGYRAAIFNGIPAFVGGAGSNTPVVDSNAADWSETSTNGATQVSSTTGETWTLNNTGALPAQIVGGASLLGNGTSHFMQTAALAIPAPYTIISAEKAISWTSGDVSFDGLTANSFAAQQITGTPQTKMWDGTTASASVSPTMGTYYIVAASQSAAGAVEISLNGGTAATGTLNATDLGGLTAFADGGGIANFWNGQKKEIIVLSEVPSAAKLAKIVALLNAIHSVF